MAKVEFEFPVSNMLGKMSKKEKRGVVIRQKHYRDADGHIVAQGSKESYVVKNPRDYKKTPQTDAELHGVTLFNQASTMAKQERNNPARLEYWTARWKAQLAKGEKDAPKDPATGLPKIYRRLDMFIISAIYRRLKAR